VAGYIQDETPDSGHRKNLIDIIPFLNASRVKALLGIERNALEKASVRLELIKEFEKYRSRVRVRRSPGEPTEPDSGRPPLPHGHRIDTELRCSWGWLRLEYVPCNSDRCRLTVDEHGPYWYSYRFVKDRWRVHYHGRQRPRFPRKVATKAVLSSIEALEKQASIDDEEMKRLQGHVENLFLYPDSARQAVAEKAQALVARERARRDRSLRERHLLLLRKAESGEELTESEQAEMEVTAAALLADH